MRELVCRWLVLLATLLLPFVLCAQPGGPDLTFMVVRDAHARPMRGPFAENAMLREALLGNAWFQGPAWNDAGLPRPGVVRRV